jgi:peptide/nickel transport system substrate-binding protein
MSIGLMLVAGCASPQTPQSGGQSSAATVANRPAGQRTLNVAVTNSIDAMSIIGSSTTSGGWQSLNELHSDGLVTADRNTQTPVARLAAQVPSLDNGLLEILPDGREKSTYPLRHDVTWQDGTPFTARDMLFSFQLDTDPKVPFLNRDALQEADSAEAPDDYTFVVYWKAPYYQADSIGLRALWPHPRHLLEQSYQTLDTPAFINLPYWTSQYVHLGAFRLTDFQPGVSLTFAAYEGYFLGRPKLDRVIVKMFNDEPTLYAATMAGSVDMLMDNSLSAELGLQLKDEWDRSGQGTVYEGTGTTRFIAPQFNREFQQQPAALDPRVRQALMSAVDRSAISATVQHGHGELIANSLLPPGDKLYDAVKDRWASYSYDPARAQATLGQLGWSPGNDGVLVGPGGARFTTNLWTTEGGESEIAIIADYWKKVGVSAEQYVIGGAIVRDREARTKYPGFETSARGSGDSILSRVNTQAIANAANRYSGGNRGGYSNPQLDQLITRYYRSISTQDQSAAIRAIDDVVAADLPVMLLYFNPTTPAVRKGIKALDDFRGGAEASRLFGTFSRNAYQWDLS